MRTSLSIAAGAGAILAALMTGPISAQQARAVPGPPSDPDFVDDSLLRWPLPPGAEALAAIDGKRMHLFHRMLHGKTKELIATNEIMQLHVDQQAGKVAPMRADIFEALSAVWAAHRKLKAPAELGRVMSVPEKDKKRAKRKTRR